MSAPLLYHFTCSHAAKRIGRFNAMLIPQVANPITGWRLLWLTVLPEPDREQTGLTSDTLRCDRMEHRYIIDAGSRCAPWLESPWRQRTPPELLADIEDGHDPEHWWVSDGLLRARWDPKYAAARAARALGTAS